MTARFLAGDVGSVGAVPERLTDLWGQRGEFSCGQFMCEVTLRRGRAGRKTSLGRAAEPGLDPWSPGCTNGGPLCPLICFSDYLEGSAVAIRSCFTHSCLSTHSD